eukprot:m.90445 g.90445  ORF g.90445 m.90445 type:complete len:88 (+) comp36645_c0_seq17:1350-1613(+)
MLNYYLHVYKIRKKQKKKRENQNMTKVEVFSWNGRKTLKKTKIFTFSHLSLQLFPLFPQFPSEFHLMDLLWPMQWAAILQLCHKSGS